MTENVGRIPRVVACMPAWNSAVFIGPVLESLAAQTYPRIDVRISVDVCTDESAELCERFAATHPNVTVVRQPVRLGWIANSNALLAAADGDYIFFALHDDPLKPEYVARLVEALEANPQAVLAFSDLESNVGTSFSYDVLDGMHDRFERARRIVHAEGAWWVPFRGLMRASTVKSLGGLQRHLAGEFSADWPWLLRLALAGEFVRVPEPLLSKRFHAASLSSIWRKGAWNALAVQLACWSVIRRAGLPLPNQLYLLAEVILFGLGFVACPRALRKVKNAMKGSSATPGRRGGHSFDQ